jgi:hypothetical protein
LLERQNSREQKEQQVLEKRRTDSQSTLQQRADFQRPQEESSEQPGVTEDRLQKEDQVLEKLRIEQQRTLQRRADLRRLQEESPEQQRVTKDIVQKQILEQQLPVPEVIEQQTTSRQSLEQLDPEQETMEKDSTKIKRRGGRPENAKDDNRDAVDVRTAATEPASSRSATPKKDPSSPKMSTVGGQEILPDAKTTGEPAPSTEGRRPRSLRQKGRVQYGNMMRRTR